MRFSVVTANICCNPVRPQHFVLARIAQAAGLGQVVFGQEIEIPRYRKGWRRMMRAHGKVSFGAGSASETPVSVPKGWTVTKRYHVRAHGGLAHISPARGFTVVCTEVQGLKVAWIGCHTVSKSYHRIVSQRSWRVMMFRRYLDRLAQEVFKLWHEGYTVIYGGDMNHPTKGMPHLIEGRKVLVESGLDHLWIKPAAGVKATVIRRRAIKRTRLMDHPLLSVTFDLEAA